MKTKSIEKDLHDVQAELARMSCLKEFTPEQQIEWHKLNGHHSYLLNKILHLSVSRKFEKMFQQAFPDIK